jgi:23S rRNA (cytosine1962-C5)-methyltransferase
LEGAPVALRVESSAERALRGGHPWLFGDSIREMSREASPGSVGVVFDRKGRFLAAGLLDPEGPIRLRVLASGKPARIGPDLFRERIRNALGLRERLVSDPGTTGYRILSGENDGMPGLVVDRYGDSLVLKIYSLSWGPHLRDVVSALETELSPDAVLLLAARRVAGSERAPPALQEPALLHGTLSDDHGTLPFLEQGLRFEAHPLLGHKTGFYLDQRENRIRVEDLVRKEKVKTGGTSFPVLNVFSYTGGFSLAAARGGATEVVSVDASGPALRQADRHFELNRDDPRVARARHRTREGDAFGILSELADEGERFRMVILDPSSFAKDAGQVRRALAGYQRLTRLGLSVLDPGGLLVQASCSSRIPEGDFHAAVHAAALQARRPLQEVERTGHPLDHPVTFPEGAYLKCLFARA